jgi:hypothetical protein
MTLSDIIQAAQGGQGVNNLAAQFGLTPDQAQAAIAAAMPAFSQGLQRSGQDPGSLGGVLSQIASDAHQASFTTASQASPGGAAGGDVLGQIFGSPQIAAQIGQRVSQASGISPQVIQQMMPVIASMLMGGLAHSMNSQGLGGVLKDHANAANSGGGLGSALPGAPGQSGQAGGLGGLISGVLGGLLGGGQGGGASPQSASLQAGLNSLTTMFASGVETAPAHQQAISDILGSISSQLDQKRG